MCIRDSIITGFLLKRAMSGQLPLMPAIKKLMDEVLSGPSMGEEIEGPLAEERKLVAQAKKLGSVSYTHLDVYKRQGLVCLSEFFISFLEGQARILKALTSIVLSL